MVDRRNRDRAYDGSDDSENPLQERTTIRAPLISLDVRLTPRLGIQAAASIPDITRTAVVPRRTGAFNYQESFSGLRDTSLLGWSYVTPAAAAQVGMGINVQAEIKLPVYRALANRQLDPVPPSYSE